MDDSRAQQQKRCMAKGAAGVGGFADLFPLSVSHIFHRLSAMTMSEGLFAEVSVSVRILCCRTATRRTDRQGKTHTADEAAAFLFPRRMQVMPAPLASHLLFAAIWWATAVSTAAALPTNSTLVPSSSSRGPSPSISLDGEEELRSANVMGVAVGVSVPRVRRRRAISARDMAALLEYHNRVRSQVSPTAANMEYMVWDESLARSAESWASLCIWDHGPPHLMKHTGQNLSINSGGYRSVIDLVRSWHDEKNAFSYPNYCTGSVCSHYTQMVWASTSRMGCAINKCSNMYVFGSTWQQAVILVCNYSIKGNWVGEAPYKRGKPCSACPSSYGGTCSRNQCSTRSIRHVQSSRATTFKKYKSWYN
ncbi:R3H domain containing-like [Engraulis encrasicolus]|uniref:R3H domain containing-like n=1 Tax=Engraulis encrasicolus TaxID=184585 RepID=UPI002FD61E50